MGIVSGGGGGGAGLPSQWTNAGHGDVTATVDSVNSTPLEVDGKVGQVASVFIARNPDTGTRITVDPVSPDLQFIADTQLFLSGGEIVFARATAAPASAHLDTSQYALWLDPTPAATKLMVKAKDSAGTVVTAAIALA